MTRSDALCSVGDVAVGLEIPSRPKQAGRAMISLSKSLMSDLPVIAGSRSCLIASSSGCSNCCVASSKLPARGRRQVCAVYLVEEQRFQFHCRVRDVCLLIFLGTGILVADFLDCF